jgi:hypothetical protein
VPSSSYYGLALSCANVYASEFLKRTPVSKLVLWTCGRCRGRLPLSKALVQALQCPLLSASASCGVAPWLHRTRAQRPVWREGIGAAGSGGADAAGAFYTIRVINGEQRVVRRPAAAKRCAYLSQITKILLPIAHSAFEDAAPISVP